MVEKHTSFIVTGPTASGKSEYAHRLAREHNGVIINCDSVQIYSGIENISASPFAGRSVSDEIDGVPYRLFSILPLSAQISVADYLQMARREYDAARGTGRTPIFVGGTGYYMNAIINGISPMPEISHENRARAREMVATDLDAARKMLPRDFTATDPQRVARAVEILINPNMSELRPRIAARIPKMVAGGALDEARAIIVANWDASRAIGAAQLCAYLRGEISRDECVADWINKTNQYAKRQRTWFRTQFAADLEINHAIK